MEYYYQEDIYAEDDEQYYEEEYEPNDQQWYEEENCDSYYEAEEEKLEPKPPDLDTYAEDEFRREYSNAGHEESYEENYYGGQDEKETYVSSYQLNMRTTNTPSKKTYDYGSSSQKTKCQSTPTTSKRPNQTKTTKRSQKRSDPSFYPFVFSGYNRKDPEAYLDWEAEMEYWFQLNHIHEDKKLTYAIRMLDGKAYNWWLKEDDATYRTSRAVLDWEDLKDRMYQEFTRKSRMVSTKAETPKPHAKGNVRGAKAFSNPAQNSRTKDVSPISKEEKTKTGNTPQVQAITDWQANCQRILELLDKMEKGKTANTLSVPEVTCYRCQGSGHKAKECPAKKVIAETQPAQELEISDNLIKSDSEISVSGLMHLSCAKKVDEATGNQGEEKSKDEPVYDKRSSMVNAHESELAPAKIDDKSEPNEPKEEVVVNPEIDELVEASDDQNPLEEPATSQDDSNVHNENLDTKVSELNQDNLLCTNLVGCTLVNRLQVIELPLHKPKRLNNEAESEVTNQIQIHVPTCQPTDEVSNKQSDQLVLNNPWPIQTKVNDLETHKSREQDHGKNIHLLFSQVTLNYLVRQELVLLMIFQGRMLAGQEISSWISVIKREQEENVGRNQATRKDEWTMVPYGKSQEKSSQVVSKKCELFCANSFKSETHHSKGNSLSLDILNQLLIYVKGLILIEKPVNDFAKETCSELCKTWFSVENNSEFELKCLYLKNMLIHLFLVLEAEYLSGSQRRLKESYHQLESEIYSKKKQEINTSAMVWYELLNSDFNLSMNPIMHLIFSLSVKQGTGLLMRSNAQGSVKEKPPDCYESTLTTTSITVQILPSNFYLNNSMAVMIHLFLPLEEELGTGLIKRRTRQRDIKEKPPDQNTRRVELEPIPRGSKGGTSNRFPNLLSFKDVPNLIGISSSNVQLKEEPPDLSKAVSFQGKSLNPHIVQRTNLLYLCVGKQVLRTKLLEGGGYDEDMTSLTLDQLEPEETWPLVERTIPYLSEPAGEPRRILTRGGKHGQDLGNTWRTWAARGNFTNTLAHLAKSMFTHQRPYHDTEEGDHLDQHTHGKPCGNIKATHGDINLIMATHGNIPRRLIMVFGGPTEAVEDLPYLTKVKGNITKVISGITKEDTANSQEPDQIRPRITTRRPTSYNQGVIEDLLGRNHHLPPLSLFSRCHLFHPTIYRIHLFSLSHFHHQNLDLTTTKHLHLPRHFTYLYSPHHIYFTNSPHFTNGYNIKTIPHFPYFQLLIINHDFLSIRSRLQRLYFSNKGIKFRSITPRSIPTAPSIQSDQAPRIYLILKPITASF